MASPHLLPHEDKFHHSSTDYHFNTLYSTLICKAILYPGNKSTYITLPRVELYLPIYLVYLYDLIYSINQPTYHHSCLRQTDPLLFLLPRKQTVPGGEAGHDIRLLQSWLVQESFSMGFFASPSSLKSLQQRQIADRGNGWVSFQHGSSTCLIVQGHIKQINRTTLMYWEVDNRTHTNTHLHGVRHGHRTISHFLNLTLDVSGMQLRASNEFISASSFVFFSFITHCAITAYIFKTISCAHPMQMLHLGLWVQQ